MKPFSDRISALGWSATPVLWRSFVLIGGYGFHGIGSASTIGVCMNVAYRCVHALSLAGALDPLIVERYLETLIGMAMVKG